MVFAEALAHGLPIIGTTGGAIPDTVPARPRAITGRAEKDVKAAVGVRWRMLIENHDRAALARIRCAGRAAQELPTWRETAKSSSPKPSRPRRERPFSAAWLETPRAI